jgi:DNA-binding NarL/FixJ family response regulator
MARVPFPQARILLVDDFEPFRRVVSAIVQARPEWQIVGEACDGSEAVQMTRHLLPDIVVLDIGMPVLNGIEAAKRIRQDSPTSKIIFLTQNNDEDIRLEALATGAEAYLLKANAGSEFLPSIEAALKDRYRADADLPH